MTTVFVIIALFTSGATHQASGEYKDEEMCKRMVVFAMTHKPTQKLADPVVSMICQPRQ